MSSLLRAPLVSVLELRNGRGPNRMEEGYRTFKANWDAGERERESALHLLFLAWMHWADPPFVTGLSDDPEAILLWHKVFEHFGGQEASDAEFLYVAAIMAKTTPWALGDEAAWMARAKRMEARSLRLHPQGFTPKTFEGREDYGAYFAHQAQRARMSS